MATAAKYPTLYACGHLCKGVSAATFELLATTLKLKKKAGRPEDRPAEVRDQFPELLICRSAEGFRLKDHPDRLTGPSCRATSRYPTCRPSFDRRRRFLSRDDLRSCPAGALLHTVNVGSSAVRGHDPELNPTVQVRIARIVRTGVAKVPDCYTRCIDALLVHQVITRIVRTGERDAHALG